MSLGLNIAEVAALLGDPGRANMMHALMDGRALTATELATLAGVTPQTASGHLAKLTNGRLLDVVAQGRHRYFRLASPDVARMLEGILVVAEAPVQRPARATPRIDPKLCLARTCYDHLAGRLAVALADSLVARGAIILTAEAGEISESGRDFLAAFGVPTAAPRESRRIYCRPCLDWSERRPHLAGALGTALLERVDTLGWVKRGETRAVKVTEAGRRGFRDVFGLSGF